MKKSAKSSKKDGKKDETKSKSDRRLPTKASTEDEASSSVASLKIPEAVKRKSSGSKSGPDAKHDEKKLAKQFEKNAEGLVEAFGKEDEETTLPIFGDEKSILEFLETIEQNSSMTQLNTMIKANGISGAGRLKIEKIRAVLEFNAKITKSGEDE